MKQERNRKDSVNDTDLIHMTKLELIIETLKEKQGENIMSIDMQQTSPFVDYFVICHASNQRLLLALKENLVDELEKANMPVKKVEGLKNSTWVLVDAGDIVVHLFDEQERQNFNLEKLWGELPQTWYS